MMKKTDIFLYGAGNGGRTLLSKIREFYDEDVNVEGFIDRQKTGSVEGVPVYRIEDIAKDKTILVTLINFDKALEVAVWLKEQGFDDIWWHDFEVWHRRRKYMSFIKDQCISCKGWTKDTMYHIEMHIMDECNLNCAGCAHFSPILPKGKPDTDKRLHDIELAAKKMPSLMRFRILGGEPLMNDEITKFIDKALSVWQDAEVSVCTNGLLIPSLPEDVLLHFAKTNVNIIVTEYRPTLKIEDKIRATLDKYNIRHDFWLRNDTFVIPLEASPSDDWCCISNRCVAVADGKISRCPTLMYVPYLNEKFGLTFPQEGVYDLENTDMTAGQLKTAMTEEVPLCRYCRDYREDWHTCGSQPQVTDFVRGL